METDYRRFPLRALACAENRCSLGRVIVLMNSARRKRNADQSSSIATMRTGSNPASPIDAQPVSRLNSQVYFFELPFGYASETSEAISGSN